VDTKWLQQHGVQAAKDVTTVEEYHRLRNHLEDKYARVRLPAAKSAEQILNEGRPAGRPYGVAFRRSLS